MGFVRYELRRRVVPDQTIYQIQAPSAFEYASNAPLPGLSMRFLAVFPSDLAHLSNPHPLDPIRTYFISLPSFGINLHHRYVVGHSLSHVYTPRTAAQTSLEVPPFPSGAFAPTRHLTPQPPPFSLGRPSPSPSPRSSPSPPPPMPQAPLPPPLLPSLRVPLGLCPPCRMACLV